MPAKVILFWTVRLTFLVSMPEHLSMVEPVYLPGPYLERIPTLPEQSILRNGGRSGRRKRRTNYMLYVNKPHNTSGVRLLLRKNPI